MSAVESINNSELPEGKKPLWKRLLDHYDIDLIVLSPFHPYGYTTDLLLELTEDREWTLIYGDYVGVVFIRNIPEYKDIIKKFEQQKENVYNIIISKSSSRAMKSDSYIHFVTLGKTFHVMGRLEDALTSYRYASQRLSRNIMLKEKIKELDAELRRKNRNM